MIVNSVLTLKLFSQKKYLTAIIDILTSYTHITKSSELLFSSSSSRSPRSPQSPRSPLLVDQDDLLFTNTIEIKDQVIRLGKYNELEILHNFDIQCFQFAISVNSSSYSLTGL